MTNTNTNNTSTMLRPAELAARWGGVSVGTLANWRCSGRGPAYVRIGGTSIRYRLSDIEEFEARNTVNPVAA